MTWIEQADLYFTEDSWEEPEPAEPAQLELTPAWPRRVIVCDPNAPEGSPVIGVVYHRGIDVLYL